MKLLLANAEGLFACLQGFSRGDPFTVACRFATKFMHVFLPRSVVIARHVVCGAMPFGMSWKRICMDSCSKRFGAFPQTKVLMPCILLKRFVFLAFATLVWRGLSLFDSN